MTVDPSTVERAEAKVARKNRRAEASRRNARKLGRTRPELVAYLVAATRRLSLEAQGVAWTGFELVCEALSATARPRIEFEELLEAERLNDELVLDLDVAHPRVADRWLRHGARMKQPALLAHLARECGVNVPPGERGAVFLTLKTIVDVLG